MTGSGFSTEPDVSSAGTGPSGQPRDLGLIVELRCLIRLETDPDAAYVTDELFDHLARAIEGESFTTAGPWSWVIDTVERMP